MTSTDARRQSELPLGSLPAGSEPLNPLAGASSAGSVDPAAPPAASPADAQPGGAAHRTFAAVAIAHFMADCFGGIWPVYKKLAGLDLSIAGNISTITLMIGTSTQPLFGIAADRRHRRRLIVLGTALTFGAMLLGPLTIARDAGLVSVRAAYLLMFAVMMAVRFGQDMFHPAGAGLAGGISSRHRSTFVAIFIACGAVGYGLSQVSFALFYKLAARHTELLLVPGLAAWVLVWRWCRPVVPPTGAQPSLRTVLSDLRSARRPLAVLFAILALSAAVNIGMQFLMPEFIAARGYPEWVADGGAFLFLILGSALMMVPAGHLADRIGRRLMLLIMLVLAAGGYHAMVRLPHMPLIGFLALVVVAGAFLGTINPLGVAFGQHVAPRNVSMVSALMMGLAWCVGSVSPSVVGPLAERFGPVETLSWLGVINIVMIGLGFLLPGRRAEARRAGGG